MADSTDSTALLRDEMVDGPTVGEYFRGSTSIKKRLEIARKELLDLGLRNRLINYRPLRSSGLEIVDEKPTEVFRILVTEGRGMTFLSNPDVEDEAAESHEVTFTQPVDELDDKGRAKRHVDNKLQTPYSSTRLQRRLLNTFYAARASIEEQGVNTLFIALGMLHWRESGAADQIRKAPLVLVPVTIDRANVASKFRLSYNGDEVGRNLSLEEKVKVEHGLKLPQVEEIDEDNLLEYFGDVARAVASLADWRVDENAVALGFFAFNKFLMYKDLGQESWPEKSSPHKNPLIRSLLGDGFPEHIGTADNVFLDDEIAPEGLHFVVDADSSQAHALLGIREGSHLIVQGPPGTGKSQTITNIVADALSQGKTVLFVAEKMAALEVVMRRLTAIGVGEACLELHSNKTNKKQFLTDLQATLNLGRPVEDDRDELLRELVRSRDQLNEYCKAANTPIGGSGITPVRAFGWLLRLGKTTSQLGILPPMQLESAQEWSGTDIRRKAELVDRLQGHLASMGLPEDHPFWGSEAALYQPTTGSELSQRAQVALDALRDLRVHSQAVSEALGLPAIGTREEAAQLRQFAHLFAEAPDVTSLAIEHDALASPDDVVAALRIGALKQVVSKQIESSFVEGTWQKDVTLHRAAVKAHGKSWYRFFVGKYRAAKSFVVGHARGDADTSSEGLLVAYDRFLKRQELERKWDEVKGQLEQVFGQRVHSPAASWDALQEEAAWALEVRDTIGTRDGRRRLWSALEQFQPEARRRMHDTHVLATEHFDAALRAALLAAGMPDPRAEEIQREPLADLEARLSVWQTSPGRLQDMVVYRHLANQLAAESLDGVVDVARSWPKAGDYLAHLFEHSWLSALVESALQERPSLAVFSGEQQMQAIARFREKDKELFDHNRKILAGLHWAGMPKRGGGGQLAVLNREFAKKRRHLPIRKLMQNCGAAIQAIKPVFMMSPLSVATYLPPESVQFDLVVFDEASQVKPVDAFGALLRSKQAVVVGDSRQLPPTSFFDSKLSADSDDEEDDAETQVGAMESILSLFDGQSAPQKMLRWHYRSRHDSLIAVSNYEFYHNRLFVFPSPHADREDMGLTLRYLPDTVYERGARKAFNRGEAKVIAQAVMEHAEKTPDLTLGVAAFSMAQMRVLQDEVELLRHQNPTLESFFSAHPEEPFFVKNLENVQGDERDVIFISVGYGKTSDGYLAMNFGPLNREGGERRLNVLISRAKRRCVVFANITHDDIDLGRTQALGVRSLKQFLRYAKDGVLDAPDAVMGEADSEFEEQVAEAIAAAGYSVDLQVGSAGFRIDIGVRDPSQPGRYLLGVECDGASYHSARWARDRDRIRQAVLEGLGWQIQRVWSTDWFRDPVSETTRVLEAIEAAKVLAQRPSQEAPSGTAFELLRGDAEIEDEAELIPPYKLASLSLSLNGLSLHEVSTPYLAQCVHTVVQAESPVHQDEVVRRVREAAGVGRAGRRIQEAFAEAIRWAIGQKQITRHGDFLWLYDDQTVTPRDRSDLPPQYTRIQLVAPEEVQAAIEQALREGFGVSREDVPALTGALLGFQRTTEQLSSYINEVLSKMERKKLVEPRGGFLFLKGD